jgi:phosphoadenosine phosphosulfate reductase
LPRNPLIERGYPSIGCWPCTRPVAPGEDKRAGRWSGHNKTECGLHVTTNANSNVVATSKGKS